MSNAALRSIHGNPSSGEYHYLNHDCWVEFVGSSPLVHFEEPITENEVCFFPAGQQIPAEWAQSRYFNFKVY